MMTDNTALQSAASPQQTAAQQQVLLQPICQFALAHLDDSFTLFMLLPLILTPEVCAGKRAAAKEVSTHHEVDNSWC